MGTRERSGRVAILEKGLGRCRWAGLRWAEDGEAEEGGHPRRGAHVSKGGVGWDLLGTRVVSWLPGEQDTRVWIEEE